MIRFRELGITDASQILKWRTSAGVTDFMTTDLDGDLASQQTWIRNSFLKQDYYHWIIVIDDVDVGLLSIANLDLEDRTTSWGFYVGESKVSGLGGIIPPFLYNFLFSQLQIKKLKVEVLETNHQVISMHLLHGYVRDFNLDRVIVKKGVQHNLCAMSLSSEDWLSKKAFQKLMTEFPMHLWKASPFKG
jgi:UDP-4-amino-4,6-dideoxy-N-acetyl-beta-L-altrosamine N-acetyltransferase